MTFQRTEWDPNSCENKIQNYPVQAQLRPQ